MNKYKKLKIALIIIFCLAVMVILARLIVYMTRDTARITKTIEEAGGDVGNNNVGSGDNNIGNSNAEADGNTREGNKDEWPDEIDFKSLKDRCPDVYAYIRIPGTNIDYPIAYCDAVEPFYWDHDIDGNESENGMIITDSLNSMDFSDPMTLIYGKNPDDGTMFSELHNFRNKDFFDSHDTVYIYLDGERYEYKIFATYLHPNKQILQQYRFDDPMSFTEFFNSIEDIRDLSKQIREEYMPDYEDYVITLVTHCDNPDERLFVQAMYETNETDSFENAPAPSELDEAAQ